MHNFTAVVSFKEPLVLSGVCGASCLRCGGSAGKVGGRMLCIARLFAANEWACYRVLGVKEFRTEPSICLEKMKVSRTCIARICSVDRCASYRGLRMQEDRIRRTLVTMKKKIIKVCRRMQCTVYLYFAM